MLQRCFSCKREVLKTIPIMDVGWGIEYSICERCYERMEIKWCKNERKSI